MVLPFQYALSVITMEFVALTLQTDDTDRRHPHLPMSDDATAAATRKGGR
jgi:hypothetical protein